jgi:GNAT superfamily N-acetyltransferase
MEVRAMSAGDRPLVRKVIEEEWGLPVVSISGVYDPSTLEGFLAEEDGELLGVVTYHFDDSGCEVVTLNSFRAGRGVGTALLEAVKTLADEQHARLWLMTTNDNVDALGFYQRRGMDIVALHRGFGAVVRAKKPAVRELGGGIPLRHAFELSF